MALGCVGRRRCWKEWNHCITVSDGGIWGLSAPRALISSSVPLVCSLRTQWGTSPSLRCSLPSGSHLDMHKSRRWGGRREVGGICQIHLCLCQLLSTSGNIYSAAAWSSSSSRCLCPAAAASHRHVFCAPSLGSGSEWGMLTWTEVNLNMWRMKCSFFLFLWVEVWWKNGDTYQITGDKEHGVQVKIIRIHQEQHWFTFGELFKKKKTEFIRYGRCYIINVKICKEACL